MTPNQPISSCEAIVESGVREDASPFRLEGVSPAGGGAAHDGSFRAWFVTLSADSEIFPPDGVSVFVRTGPGTWKPYVVGVDPSGAKRLNVNETSLDLGHVRIDQGEDLCVA